MPVEISLRNFRPAVSEPSICQNYSPLDERQEPDPARDRARYAELDMYVSIVRTNMTKMERTLLSPCVMSRPADPRRAKFEFTMG